MLKILNIALFHQNTEGAAEVQGLVTRDSAQGDKQLHPGSGRPWSASTNVTEALRSICDFQSVNRGGVMCQ